MQRRTWVAGVVAVVTGLVAPGAALAGWLPAQTVGVGEGAWAGSVPAAVMNASGQAAVLSGPERSPASLATRAPGASTFSALSLPGSGADDVRPALGDDGTLALGINAQAGVQVSAGPFAGPLPAPETVAPDTWGNVRVAVAGDGAVVAVWSQPVGGNWVVRWAIKPAGGAWGSVQGTDPAYFAAIGWHGVVSVSDDGHALITYSLDHQAYVVARAPGQAFGTPERVSGDGEQINEPPIGAVAAGGAAVVTFITPYMAADHLAFVHRASASAAWGTRTTLATGPIVSHDLVADDDGDYVLAYEAQSGTGGVDRTVLVTGSVDGTRDAPHPLAPGTLPALAIADDGTAAAVWSTYGTVRLWVTRRAPGGAWSTPRTIDDAGDVTQFFGPSRAAASLGADADGDLVAAWVARSGNYRVRLFDASTPDTLDAEELPADPADPTDTDADPNPTQDDGISTTAALGRAATTAPTLPGAGAPPMPRPAARALARCVVPSLRNHTLGGAKAMLRRAHCRLGTVTRPKALKRRAGLVVRSQSLRAGRSTGGGARVHVRLGVRPRA